MNAATPAATPVASSAALPAHERVEGLHVLRLKGSFYDMGYQHGSLLREWVSEGPMPYYRSYLERLVGKARFGKLSPVVWPLLRGLVGRRIEKKLPDFARQTIEGLAAGARIPLQDFLDGCTMPDSLLVVVSKLIRLKKIQPAIDHRLTLGLGCTSALAWGGATDDGRLLHARNFDYHGVGCWANNTVIAFHDPDEGQRYVSVGAAGVPLGGVTAMNEAGLTLTVHQHMFTGAARLGGLPIGILGDEVMRRATSLDEAEQILSAHRPIGSWTYLIADGKRREVLCFEENPDRRAPRRIATDQERFGYANIYLDKELGGTEANLYGSYWRHNLGRHQRVNALLEQGGGRSPQGMADILADIGESDCRIRQSIAMLLTVGSVIFRPEDGSFWVGAGEAPTSHGRFVPFKLSEQAAAGSAPIAANTDPEHREAFEAYRQAYLAYFDEENLAKARRLMSVSLARRPDQPLYQVIAGLLALQDQEPAAAIAAFEQAIALGHQDPERRGAFEVWRARARDLAGQREEAIAGYEAALEQRLDPAMRRAAEQGLRRGYRPVKARRLAIDFALADVAQG